MEYYQEIEGLRILRGDIRHFLDKYAEVSETINQALEALKLMIEGQIRLFEEERDSSE